MKIFLIFLLIVILALFENVVYPVPLVLYLCVGWMVLGFSRPFLLTFLAGILMGFIGGRPIGFDSIFFLSCVGVIYIYRKRILPSTLYYLIPYTIVITLIYRLMVFASFTLTNLIISFMSAFIIYGVMSVVKNRFIPRESLSL